jgi:hypothetical protein
MTTPDYTRVYKGFADGLERAEYAKTEYKDLKQFVADRGDYNTRVAKIVDRLVREYVEYEFKYSEVVAKGAVFIGPNGGDVFSMEWSALEKTKAHIIKLEEALRIPPTKQIEVKKSDENKAAADEFL